MGLKVLATAMLLAIPAAADDCKPQPIDPAVRAALAQAAARQGTACPRAADAVQLCNAVSDQIAQTDPASPDKYSYQTKIRAAACVEPEDDDALVRGKVQAFWNAHHAGLHCSQLGFSIENGHLLKLAIENNSKDFINDAVRKWQVDLNHVDAADGRTVLDYVVDERARARGTNLEPTLERYETLLRKHGAKRRSEL